MDNLGCARKLMHAYSYRLAPDNPEAFTPGLATELLGCAAVPERSNKLLPGFHKGSVFSRDYLARVRGARAFLDGGAYP
jgi:hypothetical protein